MRADYVDYASKPNKLAEIGYSDPLAPMHSILCISNTFVDQAPMATNVSSCITSILLGITIHRSATLRIPIMETLSFRHPIHGNLHRDPVPRITVTETLLMLSHKHPICGIPSSQRTPCVVFAPRSSKCQEAFTFFFVFSQTRGCS